MRRSIGPIHPTRRIHRILHIRRTDHPLANVVSLVPGCGVERVEVCPERTPSPTSLSSELTDEY
jgi:hypothetical protein